MDLSIKWQEAGRWHDFDTATILHMPRNHAIALFSGTTPVIACQDGSYITNSPTVAERYRARGKLVAMFSDLEPEESIIAHVGFIAQDAAGCFVKR